jgi:hypothetical protein
MRFHNDFNLSGTWKLDSNDPSGLTVYFSFIHEPNKKGTANILIVSDSVKSEYFDYTLTMKSKDSYILISDHLAKILNSGTSKFHIDFMSKYKIVFGFNDFKSIYYRDSELSEYLLND